MVNVILVIIVAVMCFAILIGSIYVVVYFQHPEDRMVAWIPKIIVVLGLSIAAFSLLMLPLDVGNANTPGGGGFPMSILWLVVYMVMAGFILLIIPFAYFYYEGELLSPEEKGTQVGAGLKGMFATLFFFTICFLIGWLFLGFAEIPTVRLDSRSFTTHGPKIAVCTTGPDFFTATNNASFFIPNNTIADCITGYNKTWVYPTLVTCLNSTSSTYNFNFMASPLAVKCPVGFTSIYNSSDTFNYTAQIASYSYPYETRSTKQLRFRVSPVLYIISTIAFFGWLLMIMFGGVGLAALPFDMINNFKSRPIRISLDEYTKRKVEIGTRATKLIEIGRAIQQKQRSGGKRSRKDRQNYNKFRQAVFLLEEDYEHLQTCYKRQGGEVILYYLQLVGGVFATILTLLWILHIILFVFTQPYPISPFLNDMLRALDSAWGLLGTIVYGIFSFYLLLCVIKGNFKFGLRFFFLFPIHPMKINGTLMNSFLFNTMLILVCAFSVTQFCADAFSSYTSLTAINSLFAVSVKNLWILKYFWIAYVYAMFVFIFLTAIYLFIKPTDRKSVDDLLADMKS